MKKNGFTLVELLAVIVVITIIALIAVPLVLDIIEKSKKNAFKASAYGIIDAATKKYLEFSLENFRDDMMFQYRDQKEYPSINNNYLEYSGSRPNSGDVLLKGNGEISISIHNGTYCAKKNNENEEVTVEEVDSSNCNLGLPYIDPSGASVPELSEAMIPIVWDENNWVKADISDKWYSYDEQVWANAVLVTEDSRDSYQNALPGQVIAENDVLAYLVWIPRYRYQLFNVLSEQMTAETIEIEFEHRLNKKSTGLLDGEYENGQWLTHPAFTFGNRELNGFWVGKFELTGTPTLPTVKPYLNNGSESSDIKALINRTASQQFDTVRQFSETEIYGLKSFNDAHIIKNTEWGAISYLTNSIYGKNDKVRLNDNNLGLTGCISSLDPVGGYGSYGTDDCSNEYYTAHGQEGSTTGNVYGVYDMSGGRLELTMGVMYTDETKNLLEVSQSGFDPDVLSGPTFYNYIDRYDYSTRVTGTDYDYTIRILGDATGETWRWYNETPHMVAEYVGPGGEDYPTSFYYRGGLSGYGDQAGVFSMFANRGNESLFHTTRAVIFGG